jgi:nitrate/nitrite-specific signal transduction histidine kinase
VEIAAQVNAGSVTLWVHDDGIGFVPGTPPIGRGLDHIRQRADALHADLEIRSTPGAGTLVRVSVPAGALEIPPQGAPLTATPSPPPAASGPAGRP